MQAESYLERVGFRRSPDAPVATLDRLIAMHQESAPFENIDIARLHRAIELDRADVREDRSGTPGRLLF